MNMNDLIAIWVQASLLTCVAWLACRLWRRSPRVVQFVSRCALVLLLALPVLPFLRP